MEIGIMLVWMVAMALMVMLVIGGGTYAAYRIGNQPERRPVEHPEDAQRFEAVRDPGHRAA